MSGCSVCNKSKEMLKKMMENLPRSKTDNYPTEFTYILQAGRYACYGPDIAGNVLHVPKNAHVDVYMDGHFLPFRPSPYYVSYPGWIFKNENKSIFIIPAAARQVEIQIKIINR